MKILHIISGLKSGGAEGVMYRLIDNDTINDHYVISLTDEGFYGQKLKKKKIFFFIFLSNLTQKKVFY